MRHVLLWLAAGLLLSACVQETVGGPKRDPVASARDRVGLAAVYIRNGDEEHAQQELEKALQLAPDLPEAHNMKAVLLERDGDIKGADKEYRKAIRLKADYSQAQYNYGVFLFRQGRFKDALKHYSVAAEDIGYDMRPRAYEGQGRCALKLGDKAMASYALERALKLDSSLPDANLQMGELQYQMQDYAAARNYYQRYLQLTEGLPQTAQSLWLGIRLERHGGDRNALASYELALRKLYPDSPECRLYEESAKQGE
jgi:type IV pilus assembly protein PilF